VRNTVISAHGSNVCLFLQTCSDFCRSTQCVGAAFAMATWLSVCLSRWCTVPQRLSRSSCDRSQMVSYPFQFPHTKYEPDSSTGSPSLRASNKRRVGKSQKIRQINRSHSPEGTAGRFVSDNWTFFIRNSARSFYDAEDAWLHICYFVYQHGFSCKSRHTGTILLY